MLILLLEVLPCDQLPTAKSSSFLFEHQEGLYLVSDSSDLSVKTKICVCVCVCASILAFSRPFSLIVNAGEEGIYIIGTV
jgi:hypothetical protein